MTVDAPLLVPRTGGVASEFPFPVAVAVSQAAEELPTTHWLLTQTSEAPQQSLPQVVSPYSPEQEPEPPEPPDQPPPPPPPGVGVGVEWAI